MFILMLIILIVFPLEAQIGAREGLKTAFETVIPSILPFSVGVSALVYSGMAQRLVRFFLPVARIFGINPYGMGVFVCSFLAGYPTGCKMVCDMYKATLLDKAEAEKILAYANNGGIIFALNVCGGVFGNPVAGLVIFFLSVAATFLVAVMLGQSQAKDVCTQKNKKLPLVAVMGKAVASAGGVILNITASFVVFYALCNATGLNKLPFIEGCVEMTKGIMYAGGIKNLPLGAFFFTLGGVGVLSQSAAICSECDLSLRWYIKGKIISASVAFLLAYLISGNGFLAKDIILFSFVALVAVSCAIRIIKKLYADA